MHAHDDEVAFFLRLVNCRRSRRGDWNSTILEHAELHLTVPDAIERAAWSASTSTVSVTINLRPPPQALAQLEVLSVYVPDGGGSPFCYASSTASHTAARIADAISIKLESSTFLAMALLNAIDQAVRQSSNSLDDASESHRRGDVEARVLARLKKDSAACDVLLCLLVAAASSPKGMSPCPAHFRANSIDVDWSRVLAAISAIPTVATLPHELATLPLPALHLVDWLWSRLPVSLDQVPLDQLAPTLPSSADVPHLCFAARVVQSDDPWFNRQAAKFGVKVCYHGSRLASFHSILQNGLHVMSGTRHMSSGNIFGDGIYFAESIRVAANFASPSATAWPKSAILTKAATCLAVCEVICDPSRMKLLPSAQESGAYFVVQDERCVRIKYLLFTQPPSILTTRGSAGRWHGLSYLQLTVAGAVVAVVLAVVLVRL